MRTLVINNSVDRVPRAWIVAWVSALARLLARRGHPGLSRRELVVVFVDPLEMQRMNLEYRGKEYPTDVLSFEGVDAESLGELVVCLPVLREQAGQSGLTARLELGYMLVHGVLHLLGYDHETGPADEIRMFALQDQLFAQLRERAIK